MDKEINYKEEKKIIELRHKHHKEIMKLDKDIQIELLKNRFEIDRKYFDLQGEVSKTESYEEKPLIETRPLDIPPAPQYVQEEQIDEVQEDEPISELIKGGNMYERSQDKYNKRA